MKKSVFQCSVFAAVKFVFVVGMLKKTIQIESAIDNPHQVCPMLIQAQVQNLDSKKLELLRFLHDRVRL